MKTHKIICQICSSRETGFESLRPTVALLYEDGSPVEAKGVGRRVLVLILKVFLLVMMLLVYQQQVCREKLKHPRTWENVNHVKGAFIVNLGDMMERWTNCLFRSTLHRVMPTGKERYSAHVSRMQSIARRLARDSSAYGPAIRSIYPISDQYYGGYGYDRRYASTVPAKGVGHLRLGMLVLIDVEVSDLSKCEIGIVATVFGATGFLGRYLVQELAKMGSQVLVPFRGSEDSPRHLKLMGDLGQIVPMKYNPRDENSIKAVMAKANVVINLIGREYGTRNYSLEEVNHHMAAQLAKISKEHGGIMRFIQLSCLGASKSSPSRLLQAKAAAEESILNELPEATILRPAVMLGTEDRILNPWAQFARKYNFLPLVSGGSTKIQPVYVADVASAVVAALKDDGSSMGKLYELGGPDIHTQRELAEIMYEVIREWPHYVNVPLPIAKAISSPREIFLNKVPFPLPSPSIFNLDMITAYSSDKLVSEDDGKIGNLGGLGHGSNRSFKVIQEPNLRKRHLGDLQGLVYVDAPTLKTKAYEALQSHGMDVEIPGGGESLNQLSRRCTASLQTIARERVVVVTHGGVIRALHERASTGKRHRVGRILNVSVNVLHLTDTDKWVIKSWGDVSHLNGAGYLDSGFGCDKTSG
ncbi:NAD(P)-binding domain-containing protein [Artemisia annua]|uniref:NAD(P)-binding domain-containing protein n=1 Tax=Artemisia annua TaxID=35608 RepID=A0A2U1KIJ0_ARTAN|nr:NAD(P)-binding domain-containing protein [Artemisia annua]